MTKHIESDFIPGANLEQLKNQARSLLKSTNEDNPHALARLARANVKVASEAVKLSDTQRVIAHENGCASWAELKDRVQAGESTNDDEAEAINVSGIDQIWLDCIDLEATTHFYESILCLKKSGEVPGQMVFFDCGGVTLLIGQKEEVAPNSILYLNVGDTEASIQKAYNRLKQEGIPVGESPHCIARNWNGFDVWMAFFKDPSGNQLAFKVNVPAG